MAEQPHAPAPSHPPIEATQPPQRPPLPSDVHPGSAQAGAVANQPTDHALLVELASKFRQAQIYDDQTSRHVRFTEDEMKAMADMLDAMAERMSHVQMVQRGQQQQEAKK